MHVDRSLRLPKSEHLPASEVRHRAAPHPFPERATRSASSTSWCPYGSPRRSNPRTRNGRARKGSGRSSADSLHVVATAPRKPRIALGSALGLLGAAGVGLVVGRTIP